MITFKDLKTEWDNQPIKNIAGDGAKIITKKITFLKRKQQITNIVLSITGLILIGFFFYISAYKVITVMYSLLLMISALFIRVVVEILSIRKLKKLNVLANVNSFKEQIVKYYEHRIKIHFLLTPLAIISYCIGFILLLPFFKENLSSGFYLYIIISSILLLFVIGIFILRQIQNELKFLRYFKSDTE